MTPEEFRRAGHGLTLTEREHVSAVWKLMQEQVKRRAGLVE